MALCEDCICKESCEDWAEYYEDKEFPYGYCRHFKPKSRFIELPCAVRDFIEYNHGYCKGLYQVIGFYFDDQGVHIDIGIISPLVNHPNITRILTKEEAEKALKK